jgi:hypothetical protein
VEFAYYLIASPNNFLKITKLGIKFKFLTPLIICADNLDWREDKKNMKTLLSPLLTNLLFLHRSDSNMQKVRGL